MRLLTAIFLFLVLSIPATAKINDVWHNPDGSTITFFNNYHSAIISGRHMRPWYQKSNPIWWYENDAEPTAPDWYKPGQNQAWRNFSWYMRNPFQNAGKYVFGIADRNYRVDGNVDLRVGADLVGAGKTGCIKLHFTHITGIKGRWREFIGCTSNKTVWYAGTQWLGFYGFKWNYLHSNFQAW